MATVGSLLILFSASLHLEIVKHLPIFQFSIEVTSSLHSASVLKTSDLTATYIRLLLTLSSAPISSPLLFAALTSRGTHLHLDEGYLFLPPFP